MKKCFILVLCFQLIACEASAMQSLAAAARWCATVAATVGAGAMTYAWYKKHWPFAKPIDRVALAAVKEDKPEVFALCLAMHPRLGASSPARWLPSDVVKEIDQWVDTVAVEVREDYHNSYHCGHCYCVTVRDLDKKVIKQYKFDRHSSTGLINFTLVLPCSKPLLLDIERDNPESVFGCGLRYKLGRKSLARLGSIDFKFEKANGDLSFYDRQGIAFEPTE